MTTSSDAVRERLLLRLAQARLRTDSLFAGLIAQAEHAQAQAADASTGARSSLLYQRPIAERHRLIFYLGHLEAFDWNLLGEQLSPGRGTVNAAWHRLFAFGIDPTDGALPQDQAEDWPALQEVLHYCQQVRLALDGMLADWPMRHPSPWAGEPGRHDAACLLSVAIEHRLMHAETLVYMLHRLPVASVRSILGAALDDGCAEGAAKSHVEGGHAAGGPGEAVSAAAHPMVFIPAGPVTLGAPRGDLTRFGWDNEYPQQVLEVPAFSMDRYMVSNAQYLAFVEAGGYADARWWTEDDWAWIRAQGIRHPAFWRRDEQAQGSRWLWRHLGAEVPLPLDGPVYVSHAEAQAYACWAGKALPTEAQWMRAASGIAHHSLRMDDRYSEALGPECGNFDFRHWDPQSVHAPSNVSAYGVVGLFGNGWEWTCTPFAPLADTGFAPWDFYRGYSQDFFDGRHYVLKGGSARTAACMLRPGFRNWFQPHYPHVYAGLRCVTSNTAPHPAYEHP